MQRGFGLAQRGAVIPLVALTLAVLMGFAGTAVDIGFLEYNQQAQQAATDAAAEGGAQSAYANNCASWSTTQAAAKADAATNGYSSSAGTVLGNTASQVTVTVTQPSSGPYANNPCAVAVSITSSKQTFFSRIFGYNSMPETTQAIGLGSQNVSTGCLYALSTSSQSNLSNMTINTPHCKMYLNGGANMSNSSLNANFIGYTGSNNTGGTTFGSASPTSEAAVADPCPSWAGCKYLTSNPPPTSGCTDLDVSANGQTIGAANTTTCVGSLTVSGTGETMCGLIEVTGSQLHLNGATITSCSSGVTIAMSSNTSDINFSTANLNLWAPSTGNTADVVVWRNSAQNNTVTMANCTCDLTGMVYFPTAQVTYSSAGGGYTMLVFGEVNFSTSNMTMGTPPPNYAGQVATLAQ